MKSLIKTYLRKQIQLIKKRYHMTPDSYRDKKQ